MSIRHDHYQSPTHIHLSLYLKGLRDQGMGVGGEGGVRVEINDLEGGEQELKIFLLPPYTTTAPSAAAPATSESTSGPQLLLHLSPLYGRLKSGGEAEVGGGVGVRVLNMKIELSLPKANPGESWSALTRPAGTLPRALVNSSTSGEKNGNGNGAALKEEVDDKGVGDANGDADGDKTLLNPTTSPSSKQPQPSNKSKSKKFSSYSRFDSLSLSSSEEESSSERETETDPAHPKEKSKKPKTKKKKAGDGQLEDFFQGLYGGLSDEGKRAMMKSFTESGGTVLSTDWNDVGSRKVAPAPPDGQEEKKY